MALGVLVGLTWAMCASYLVFDQFPDFEDPDAFSDWVVLMELPLWALEMPLIILIVGGIALVLIWTDNMYSRRRGPSGIWLPLGLTVMTMGVSAALWMAFQRSESLFAAYTDLKPGITSE